MLEAFFGVFCGSCDALKALLGSWYKAEKIRIHDLISIDQFLPSVVHMLHDRSD